MSGMRKIRAGRATYSGGQRLVAIAAALLAACGVAGIVPATAQASSASTPTWTQQAPADHPSARMEPAMAYDAATSSVVLFGGFSIHGTGLSDTWTWDGTTWTQQHPAAHPSARLEPAMAYDAATGTVVLFGGLTAHGEISRHLRDTWIWG